GRWWWPVRPAGHNC
ncbi:hypothetical protein EC100869_3006, partial [Escherichia coli 10.0869]